jgi:hypothetical protein
LEQTYNRVDLATEQLDVALSLLETKSFVSALTLAGAADEILGKMLSHSGKQNYLDCLYEVLGPFRTRLHRMPQSKEDFIRDENRALIAVTRVASASTPSVTLDLEAGAYRMIVRALYNHDQLGLPRTARMLEFRNQRYENVVGRAEEAYKQMQALRDRDQAIGGRGKGRQAEPQNVLPFERASSNTDSGVK